MSRSRGVRIFFRPTDATEPLCGPTEVYWDFRDWWIGYYRGDTHHYVCPLPCLVIRWRRG